MYREMIESLIKLRKANTYSIKVLRSQHNEHEGDMEIHTYIKFSQQMSKLKKVDRRSSLLIDILIAID